MSKENKENVEVTLTKLQNNMGNDCLPKSEFMDQKEACILSSIINILNRLKSLQNSYNLKYSLDDTDYLTTMKILESYTYNDKDIKIDDNIEEIVYNINRLYNSNLPRMKYDKSKIQNLDNLHWGQRKLLLSEIEFLTNYWSSYNQNKKKYLLYIGAAPGVHIQYLSKLFPDIHFILYDPANFIIKPSSNITIHQKYFTDEDVKQYKNMNLFFISDIREREVGEYKLTDPEKFNETIRNEMNIQKKWFEELNPKKALLKFRVIWEEPTTTYLDGDLYFQIWQKNASIEMRLVPKTTTIIYDNKNIEEVNFYHNMVTRRSAITDITEYNCIGGNYYDSITEGIILSNYIKKFRQGTIGKELLKMVCNLSYAITYELTKIYKNKVSNKFLKPVTKKYEYINASGPEWIFSISDDTKQKDKIGKKERKQYIKDKVSTKLFGKKGFFAIKNIEKIDFLMESYSKELIKNNVLKNRVLFFSNN